MRVSIRRVVRFLALILTISFVGILVLRDGPLFTIKHTGNSTSKWTSNHDEDSEFYIVKSNMNHGSGKLLFRSQRSAKSIDHSVSGYAQDSRARAVDHKTELDDVFISVKTSGKNHRSRLKLLLETWISNAKEQTYIFTDEEDDLLTSSLPDGHVINTNCKIDHDRKSLNCKMAQEFDMFITKGKPWFCHTDDDTYINTVKLVEVLRRYNHTDDWYLGKPSLGHPIETIDRSRPGQKLAFWFATGGAGFCISRALALKMIPYAGGGRFMRAGENIRLPDDCTIGYVINSILHKELTVIDEFHSHLEALAKIRLPDIKNQVSFSYLLKEDRKNIVKIIGVSEEKDPTRFWSIHCHLNPLTKPCLDLR